MEIFVLRGLYSYIEICVSLGAYSRIEICVSLKSLSFIWTGYGDQTLFGSCQNITVIFRGQSANTIVSPVST